MVHCWAIEGALDKNVFRYILQDM